MRVAWHEGYAIPLPDWHRFPMAKYAALRERLVLESCCHAGVPLVILAAGGYPATPEAAADLHATVHREARRVFGADRPAAPAGIAEPR